MRFEKVFSNARDVIVELERAADQGEKLAIILWPTEQFGKAETPPTLRGYGVKENVTVYGLQGRWWEIEKEVFHILISPERMQRIQEFEERDRRTDSSFGKVVDTSTFLANIRKTLIQVVCEDEWWQAFGGAHEGSCKRILLVNRSPLEVSCD